ncbi:Growth arrest and DNA damage-inducible protein GADD45 gamma [Mactra antiquata]
MTLSDLRKRILMEAQRSKLREVGSALREAMAKSCKEHRLIWGVVECARQLENSPDEVMVCILPETLPTQYYTPMAIQHTLMKAYCQEHEIPVIKVVSISPVSEIFKKGECMAANDGNKSSSHPLLERKSSNALDFSCFLIKKSHALSQSEYCIQVYCDDVSRDKEMVIELPS